MAFYEYYLLDRATAVNGESINLLKQFRESAEARYKAGQVAQQDLLQVNGEVGRQ